MAKAQVKKTAPKKAAKKAGSAKPARRTASKAAKPPKPSSRGSKPAARGKSAPVAKKQTRPAASKTARPAPVKPAKPAGKKAAAAKVAKNVARAAVKATARAVAKAVVKSVVRNPVKAAAVAAVVPVAAKAASAVVAKVVEKRARRPRTRVTSSGTAVANWFSQEKARPSSFIPAPPRAEAPSLVAAPPASSDRLIRPEDVSHVAVRTVPVRVDIEQSGGRVYIGVNPMEVSVKAGEGIEWDFRYLGGADVTVDEIVIEFEKPSPFASALFRSRKPGGARPHRQLSGGAAAAAAGKRVSYTIRASTAYKVEVPATKPAVNVVAG